GKHAGMLTLALHLGVPTEGYSLPDHPVQQAVLAAVGELCGREITPACCGIDGCSLPNPAMSLAALARGYARFMRPETLSFQRGTACRHIYQAAVDHPAHVGGSGRLDTVLMQAAKGSILSKTGAEGTYIA